MSPRAHASSPGPIGARASRLLSYAEVFGPGPEDLLFEEAEIFGLARRGERHRYGPTGSREGVGGYLEYNLVNRMEFTRYFNPLMPTWLLPRDLMVMSTYFQTRLAWQRYRVLPPRTLWPRMESTLALLREVQQATNVQVTIHSAYRSRFVNRKSRGAANSTHMKFSALDITVERSDLPRVRAYLEHYWWERGDALNLGLNFYRSGRFHMDTNSRRHRTRGWDSDSRARPSQNSARRNYERHFTTPL